VFLERRRRVWYALHTVPPRLRKAIGKVRFVVSLGTEDEDTAKRRAAVIEAKWLSDIAKGRTGNGDHIDQDAEFWRKALEESPPEHRDMLRNQIADEAEERIQRAASRKGIVDERDPEYHLLPEHESAERFFAAATGQLVAFDAHLEEWLAHSNNVQKSKDMKASTVRAFTQDFPFIQDVKRKAVQGWVNRQAKGGKKAATISRALSELRGYWSYLTSIEAVQEDSLPLEKLSVPRPSSKDASEDTRQPFEAMEVVGLLKGAVEREDEQLADLIRLGMWSGARLEELSALKVKDVKPAYFEVKDAKSPAGRRQIPIHSKLRTTMRRLIRDSKDGYVLSGLSANKYKDRGNAVGKRFGRLKTSMGFGAAHVFHSIRKTVATMLENAGVVENVAADIIGHDKPTMTYGLYSGGNSLKVKQAAIEKLNYGRA